MTDFSIYQTNTTAIGYMSATTTYKLLHLLSTTAMATVTELGAKDVRGLEDQNMEVDQQEQQVEQVSQESKEPEPEKPVSRFGCASE